MKKLFYFSVHPLCILTEVPPFVLLYFAYRYNDKMQIPEKLYPLMAVCVLAILFTFIYFFRGLLLDRTTFLSVGVFSSKDTVSIKKGTRIVLTKCPHGVKKIEVIGNDETPALEMLKGREPQDISKMREKFYAGDGALYRIGGLFGVPTGSVTQALTEESYREEAEAYVLFAERKNEIREITVTVKDDIPKKEVKAEKYHFRLFDR